MLETLIVVQIVLYLLGGAGLVYWLRKNIGALRGAVDAPQAQTIKTQPEEREDLWKQLANVVAFSTTQAQIVWTVFGVFWGANAVLLVALFTTGRFPAERLAGLVVSFVGLALSLVWLAIQYRAIAWSKCYEDTVMKELECRLGLQSSVRLTGHRDQVGGIPVRCIMVLCPVASAVLWGWLACRFLTHLC